VPRVLFGRGAVARVGPEAEALGQRVLFVCTPSLKRSPHAAQLRAVLGSRLVGEFTDVLPHVPKETVDAARARATQTGADVVVALGGGSAIGVGKGVALLGIGLIAIPTTYAGSEMTPVVGFTDRAEGRKRVQRDPAALPKLAVYDPDVTLDLPAPITASTAMNALAHCVEACYATDVNPVVPPVALEGIRRITRSLPRCLAASDDIEARQELLTGAYLGAFSIANASMGLHHGLCHVIGGRTGVAHGVLNAILLPHVIRFNADAVPDAMTAIAQNFPPSLAGEGRDGAATATATLVESLPVPSRLRDVGVPAEALEPIAREAAASATVKANPKPVTESDIVQLLQAAWG
jgi:maleylacetate reductase